MAPAEPSATFDSLIEEGLEAARADPAAGVQRPPYDAGAHWQELARRLQCQQHLTSVLLVGQQVSDGGVRALAAALAHSCPRLTLLNLCENSFGRDGALALAAVLPT